MRGADMSVHFHKLRRVNGDQHLRQAAAQLLGVCFHDDIGAVIKRFVIAVGVLVVHYLYLVVRHAARRDGGMAVKDKSGARGNNFLDAAVKRFKIFFRE